MTNLCFNQLNMIFLGFVLDSLNMSICLTDTRKGAILDIGKNLTSGDSHKIRTVASAVGCFIAALPGVKLWWIILLNPGKM